MAAVPENRETSSEEARRNTARSVLNAAVSQAYAEAKGPLDNRALVDRVAQLTGIPSEAFDEKEPVGRAGKPRSLLQRAIRWHQQTLRQMGVLERERRGVWKLVGKPGQELNQILTGHALLVFSTDLGVAIWADCRTFFENLGEKITLTLTSPPYPLRQPRAYGNPSEQEYVDFICRSIEPLVEWLRPGGAVCLQISNDIFLPGLPARSLYRERLVLALAERLGLFKMDEIIWANESKPPSPVLWASRTRQQLNAGWDPVYVFTNDPTAFLGDNRRVLQPHSARHLALMQRGGERRDREFSDGAYTVRPGAYGRVTEGRIPKNVLRMGHACGDQRRYKEAARGQGLPAHGAPYPVALAEFLIRYLSEPGSLVADPFGGSLSTGVAAERAGRRWVATDISWEYLRGGAERFRQAPGFQLQDGPTPTRRADLQPALFSAEPTSEESMSSDASQQKTVDEILQELKAMSDVGMRVPAGAADYVRENAAAMVEYRENGMSYTEIADLVVDLAPDKAKPR